MEESYGTEPLAQVMANGKCSIAAGYYLALKGRVGILSPWLQVHYVLKAALHDVPSEPCF